jgi:hypothetical protein
MIWPVIRDWLRAHLPRTVSAAAAISGVYLTCAERQPEQNPSSQVQGSSTSASLSWRAPIKSGAGSSGSSDAPQSRAPHRCRDCSINRSCSSRVLTIRRKVIAVQGRPHHATDDTKSMADDIGTISGELMVASLLEATDPASAAFNGRGR